jgi:sugar lactone lactonase YvrE
VPDASDAIAIAPDGRRLYLAHFMANTVSVLAL